MTEILAGGFLPGVKPHWREDSIFDTFGRISCKPGAFFCLKGIYRFNKSNGSNREKILRFIVCILVFLYYVGHKPQVSFYQNGFCFLIALPATLQVFPLFFCCQWFWKSFQKKPPLGHVNLSYAPAAFQVLFLPLAEHGFL